MLVPGLPSALKAVFCFAVAFSFIDCPNSTNYNIWWHGGRELQIAVPFPAGLSNRLLQDHR